MENSPNSNDYSKDAFQNQPEKFVKKNLPSAGELASENQHFPSPRSVAPSYQLSNQSPNMDQLNETYSSSHVYSSRDLRNYTNRSQTVDAVTSPKQNPIASSPAVLQDTGASGVKIHQRKLSPFAANRSPDFSSPPNRSPVLAIKSLSKKMSTPSPEKRSAVTDMGSTPLKRSRKTPEGDSGKSRTKHSSGDDLLETTSSLNLSTVSNESTDASSASLNLETRKQKNTQSTLDEKLLKFISKTNDAIMHLATSMNTSSLCPNMFPENKGDRLTGSDASFEAVQADLSAKETESTEPSVRLKDETSSSNNEPVLKSENSTTEGSQSHVGGMKMHDSALLSAEETQWASNLADSAVKTRISRSRSSPNIFRPYLPSYYLPRRVNSSVDNIPQSKIEFCLSDKVDSINQIRSDSSTQASTQDGASKSQSKVSSVSRRRGILRRSLSDKTLNIRNSPERSQIHSFQGLFPKSDSEESSRSHSLKRNRRSASDEALTSRNSCEVQSQLHQSNARSRSKETPSPKGFFKIPKGVDRTTCVVQPLFQAIPAKSSANTTATTSNRDYFNRLFQGTIESLLPNVPSTPRNDAEVQMHQNDAPIPQRIHEGLVSEQASISNQREVLSDLNPPYIDVVEGQASTSRYQPMITSTSSLYPSVRDMDFRHRLIFLYLNTRCPLDQPCSSEDESCSSSDDSSSSPNNSQSGEVAGRRRGSFETFTKHMENVAEARMLLQSVLKEMLLCNGRKELWKRLDVSFRRLSETCSEQDCMNLHSELISFLANRGYCLWNDILFQTFEVTAETYMWAVYEKLLASMVSILAFILRVAKTRDYGKFFHYYKNFRTLYRAFLEDCRCHKAECIRDETSRSVVKKMREMMHSLFLRALCAFRLLLMFIGEHFEGEIDVELYGISAEDMVYFRRNRDRY